MDRRNSETLIALSFCLLLLLSGYARSAEEDFNLLYSVPPTPERCCGVDSLYVCLALLDGPSTRLKTLDEELPLGPKGLSVENLVKACESRGISTMVVRTNLENLIRLRNPIILHVSQSHFVALLGYKDGKLLIFDNGTGLFECSPDLFKRVYSWQGVAVIVGTPSPYALLIRNATPSLMMAGFLLGLIIFVWQRGNRKGRNAATKADSLLSPTPVNR